jgi:hypothetical protein
MRGTAPANATSGANTHGPVHLDLPPLTLGASLLKPAAGGNGHLQVLPTGLVRRVIGRANRRGLLEAFAFWPMRELAAQHAAVCRRRFWL